MGSVENCNAMQRNAMRGVARKQVLRRTSVQSSCVCVCEREHSTAGGGGEGPRFHGLLSNKAGLRDPTGTCLAGRRPGSGTVI